MNFILMKKCQNLNEIMIIQIMVNTNDDNPNVTYFFNITTTNELFYTGVVVVTNRLGVKTDKAAKRKEPMWRRGRLQSKIKELRKDLKLVSAIFYQFFTK